MSLRIKEVSMGRRRERIRPTRAQTSERILEGAAASFAERGFHGATIDDIASRAGLTRGAFHSSFESKEDLFLALYDHMSARLRDRLSAALAQVTLANGSLEAALRDFYQGQLERDWYLLSTEFNLYAVRQPLVARRLATHHRALREALISIVEEFLARHGRRLTADRDKVSRLLLAIHEGNQVQSLMEPDTLDAGDLTATFAGAIMHSVSAEDAPATQSRIGTD